MDEITREAFAPLCLSETLADLHHVSGTGDDITVIAPAPEHAGDPASAAARLCGRKPDAIQLYRDSNGRVQSAVARWNAPDGKQLRPLAWVRYPDGRETWALRQQPAPRPIYNLDQLTARPDATVVVCEGEKTADAAGRIFPDCVATTSPAGAYAAKHADWSPLRGRTVLVLSLIHI